MSEVFQKIVTVIKEDGLSFYDVHEHSKLVEDLGLDSLDIVELTMSIEREFNIDIPDELVEKWVTVADAVETVTKQLALKSAAA